jgi:cysteine desulfurase/selenocysteine lyase
MRFPVSQNLIYFNHAACGPLSVPAYDAMESHARDQRDFGALHWREWYAEYDAVRASAARLIGADPAEIAILKNTSEGLSFVAEGLRWREGDNLVTSSLEFPSNWTPWKRLEARGVDCRRVEAVNGIYGAEDVERLIDARTRLVTLSSVAFHNGFAPDLEAIGEICARRGVLFCLDAIQSLGVLPVDVRRAKVDILAADGHKWLCAPEGAAIFYVAAEKRDLLDVVEMGWTNIDRKGSSFLGVAGDLLPDARRWEAGSLNTNGIYGLRASIDLLLGIGIEEVARRALAVATHLAEGLESIGWAVAMRRPLRSPIVGATPPSVEKSILWYHRRLEEAGIVTSPREGKIRFSPHFYNTTDEAERVVDVLREL